MVFDDVFYAVRELANVLPQRFGDLVQMPVIIAKKRVDRTAGYDPRVMFSTGGPICLVQHSLSKTEGETFRYRFENETKRFGIVPELVL